MAGWKDAIESSGLLGSVAKVAPLLGGALGSPLAGIVVSLLASAFGVNAKDIDALNTAINADPQATVKLKQIEDDHVEALAKIASEDYATEVSDRINARQTAVLYKDFLRHMAYLVTAGFFGALVLLFFPIVLNPDERELLSMLVGVLVSKWQTIIDFFYGSSRGKTDINKES